MQFLETEIPGVILVEPDVHGDERGFLLEAYHEPRYRSGGIRDHFVQDNHSRSAGGTLRGLHGQFPHTQAKLVRAIEGEIYDVAVDARLNSPSFGKFVAVILSADNHLQLYIPPGFVHGFCVTSDVAQVEYKCSEIYHPDDEFSVAWNDPELGIPWPVADPALSKKDRGAPPLREVGDRLIAYRL